MYCMLIRPLHGWRSTKIVMMKKLIILFYLLAFCIAANGQTELNPASQIINQYNVAGAASAVEALDEGAPGFSSDYVWDCNPTDQMELKLDPGTDPGTDLNHKSYFMISHGSNGGTFNFQLKQGATIIESWSQFHIGTTATAYSHTFSSSNIANITDYTDLRLRVQVTRANLGCHVISQMSIEVPAPVASGYPNKVMGVTAGAVNGVTDPFKVMGR